MSITEGQVEARRAAIYEEINKHWQASGNRLDDAPYSICFVLATRLARAELANEALAERLRAIEDCPEHAVIGDTYITGPHEWTKRPSGGLACINCGARKAGA